jgi:hypothetical protein
MTVDERARHRLYRRLEEVLGPEEAGVLMNHLLPAAASDLVTRHHLFSALDGLEHKLTAKMETLARQLVIWTSSMVLAAGALGFAAGGFALARAAQAIPGRLH